MSQHLFDEITDMNNIENAYRKALKGDNKYSTEAIKFHKNETYNLQNLQRSLVNGTYEFSGYIRFKVFEPKERVIDAPHFKDKIVQLAINDVLKQVYQPCFIYDSYACLDNKGTHKAVERVQYFLRKAAWEYGPETKIIKLDVRKFFYTIDRGILKGLISKKIKCKQTLNLLYLIIDSADAIDDIGLPLGNTLSQLFANIYMNEFDQYCKRILRIKYYVRYADDVIAVVKNKDVAKQLQQLMIEFLNNKLSLAANMKKTKLFPVEQGVNAYGFKIYKTHRLLRNQSKRDIKRKAKKMRHLIPNGDMSVMTAEQILNSWLGHAHFASSLNFINRLIERNPHIYMDFDNKLRVNTQEVFANASQEWENVGDVSA